MDRERKRLDGEPVPGEEAVAVEPVGLLAVEEWRLSHGGDPHVALGDLHLAALALSSPGLGIPGGKEC